MSATRILHPIKVLLQNAPPPPSDLRNSIVTHPSAKWSLLLTTWPTNGFAIDVARSMSSEDGPFVTGELISSKTSLRNGRLSCASCVARDGNEVWCIAQERRLVTIMNGKVMLDQLIRYEANSIGIGYVKVGDKEELVVALGGPRGVVLQVLDETQRLICFYWRRYTIRHVAFSPCGRFLLAAASTGHFALWRMDDPQNSLFDEAVPWFSSQIPSAAICNLAISPINSEYLVLTTWQSSKNSRPMQHVYQNDPLKRYAPVEHFAHLRTSSETKRSGPLLPPPPCSIFSVDGTLFASTSSPSSLNVWALSNGTSVGKFDLDDPEDEIVGLAAYRDIFVVRTAMGKLISLPWPDIRPPSRLVE